MTSPLLVVSDTSPVSALVVMGWLEWLRERWQEVVVPEVVWDELRRRSSDTDWKTLENARNHGWLTTARVKDAGAVSALAALELHPGECEAIALACELNAGWLLMDEWEGRRIAEQMGLRIAGTAGMVLWAKQQRFIESARDALRGLRTKARFFLDDALVEHIARAAGE